MPIIIQFFLHILFLAQILLMALNFVTRTTQTIIKQRP